MGTGMSKGDKVRLLDSNENRQHCREGSCYPHARIGMIYEVLEGPDRLGSMACIKVAAGLDGAPVSMFASRFEVVTEMSVKDAFGNEIKAGDFVRANSAFAKATLGEKKYHKVLEVSGGPWVGLMIKGPNGGDAGWGGEHFVRTNRHRVGDPVGYAGMFKVHRIAPTKFSVLNAYHGMEEWYEDDDRQRHDTWLHMPPLKGPVVAPGTGTLKPINPFVIEPEEIDGFKAGDVVEHTDAIAFRNGALRGRYDGPFTIKSVHPAKPGATYKGATPYAEHTNGLWSSLHDLRHVAKEAPASDRAQYLEIGRRWGKSALTEMAKAQIDTALRNQLAAENLRTVAQNELRLERQAHEDTRRRVVLLEKRLDLLLEGARGLVRKESAFRASEDVVLIARDEAMEKLATLIGEDLSE